jgi:Fe-S-cluster containining protein
MEEIERFKEEILKEYERLSLDSEFNFSCHPGVACYNQCCADINIFLTPYDVVRMKNALGMTSQEFLSEHTVSPFDKNLKYPVILLKMNEDEKKTCPFVGEKGCGVYENRPWACRMYPLGMASPGEGSAELDDDFYFLLEEGFCKGHKEDTTMTVAKWLEDQGIDEFNKNGQSFKELTLHKYFQEGQNLPPQKIEMFFLACYNLDSFRDFVFKSSFFDKFEVDETTKKKIEKDDVELLKFGYSWLRFALFGEETMTVKSDALDAKQKELDAKDAMKAEAEAKAKERRRKGKK